MHSSLVAIYARQGVEIERSTLAGWVGGASELLAPLIDAIQKHVLAGAKLHADDTPMPVLAPGSGKTKTGRLWTYVRDDRSAGEDTAPAVWFAYSEDRKGEHPRQHLKNFKGGLQADAYAGFHHLYGDGAIYEVACWAHARRKFHEIHVIHASPTTTEAVTRIGALYASVPISTDEPNSTSRTHSDSVNPADAARDSSTRNSASETLVPTDFVRSARFTRHLRRSVFEGSAFVFQGPAFAFQGPAFVFQGSDARRPHGNRAASASRQAGC